MKKALQVTMVTLLLISYSKTTNAQDADDMTLTTMVDFETFEEHNTKFNSKTKSVLAYEERMAKARAYDLYVSRDFGSYLNPYDGNLNIVNNGKKQFSRAQLTHAATKKKAFSVEIDHKVKSISIEDYDPGEYILILSNDQGDIMVETFIII